MSDFVTAGLVLLGLSTVFLILYLPAVFVTRLLFHKVDFRARWLQLLSHPIGPFVPSSGATPGSLRQAAAHWFVLAIACAGALIFEWLGFEVVSTFWSFVVLSTVILSTAFAGLVACIESAVLLVRVALLRWSGGPGVPVQPEQRRKEKPPNYTLHPSSGVGLGADVMRAFARRG